MSNKMLSLFASFAVGGLITAGIYKYLNKTRLIQDMKTHYRVNINDPSLLSSLVSGGIYQQVINELFTLKDDKPVHIYLNTLGGEFIFAEMICKWIKTRKQPVIAYVEKYALSAGTIISLACTEVKMTNYSCLSAIDTVVIMKNLINVVPVKKLTHIFSVFTENKLDFTGLSEKTREMVVMFRGKTRECFNDIYSDEIKEKIIAHMYDDPPVHERTFYYDELKGLGINVSLIPVV